MLSREHRLCRAGDFARVRREGRAWSHPWLVLTAVSTGGSVTRVGFTVSKRVGKAHTRNRVKRVLREVVRAYLPSIPTGYDIVIISRPSLVGKSSSAVDEVVRRQLTNARLLGRTNSA
ncbi:MAG: ribonuclease protein component [Chloroflexi bacterium]|nr:ribonuclease protein component [Chloroflexota bacterium]